MKGIVFTEFNEMVESQLSPGITDRIILEAAPASSAACTAVGTCDLEMRYASRRPFADLAEGLIDGCAGHCGEHVSISPTEGGDGRIRFKLPRSTQ